MNYANLQMVPFASPAPFMVPRDSTGRTDVPLRSGQPPRKKAKQRAANGEDIITPVQPTAQASAQRWLDDDDEASLKDFDKGVVFNEEHTSGARQSLSTGVQKMEIVTSRWTRTGIIIAWTGMLLLAIALSLDSLTVSSYQPYALSEFKSHSMLPVVSTLQSIL